MAPSSFTPSVATPEERFWHDLDLRGKTVYDIGAFHGLLTLFFAVRAKSVVSFEPNGRNRASCWRICGSIRFRTSRCGIAA